MKRAIRARKRYSFKDAITTSLFSGHLGDRLVWILPSGPPLPELERSSLLRKTSTSKFQNIMT
jgi:hypothetical protein